MLKDEWETLDKIRSHLDGIRESLDGLSLEFPATSGVGEKLSASVSGIAAAQEALKRITERHKTIYRMMNGGKK